MNYAIRTKNELELIEDSTLAPYAKRSADVGETRIFPEEPHLYRTAFQRDRDRIVHSRAFRRLKHKRQVFLTNEGDHYRTRLTHTLEVSQLSRTISKALGLNEELVETIALGHDLGHTPFGHIGETVLDKIVNGSDTLDGILKGVDHGGFKHNYQSLRVIDKIEKKYIANGLNLTAPVREGILKHTHLNPVKIHYPEINEKDLYLEFEMPSTLEGQVVAICDEIAQHTHDLEDGLRARFVEISMIRNLAIVQKIEKQLQIAPLLSQDLYLYRNLFIRGLINLLVTDVIANTISNLSDHFKEQNKTNIFNSIFVGFSKELDPLHSELDSFIDKEIIFHASIYRADDVATNIIRSLFKFYYLYPSQLPDYVFKRMKAPVSKKNDAEFIRVICDYIAGMTDNFAETEYKRIESIIRTTEIGNQYKL
jgi:dGTPase